MATLNPKKSKSIGIAFFVAFVIAFIWYWAHLLGPVQKHAVEHYQATGEMEGFLTTFGGALLWAIIWGIITGFLSYMGFLFLNQTDRTTDVEFDWYDVVQITSFWLWLGCWTVAIIFFTLMWRGDL